MKACVYDIGTKGKGVERKMPAYAYVAIDENGKQKKGTIEANSVDAAKSTLKGEGKIPISIEVPNALTKDLDINIGGKVKARDLAVFCKQFQSILHAGVNIIQALEMLGEQTENKRLRKAIIETRTLVEKGDTLAGAMATQEGIFPDILINMMEAGEASGSIEVSLERMAVHFDKDAKIKSMAKQAMIYPVVLLIVVAGVVAVMLVKVVPSFEETFSDAGAELPAITIAVVNISNFLIARWPIFLGAVVLVIVAIKVASKTESGAMILGRVQMKIPLLGDLTMKTACSRLTRTLSTLMASGMPMVSAIEISAKIMSNRIVQLVLEDAQREVERGVALSIPLESSGIFPPLLCHMTKIGEETGNIEEMMNKVADYYDEEVENATKAITAVLEPAIIILMAAIVVPIIMAILMPMMGIYAVAENS